LKKKGGKKESKRRRRMREIQNERKERPIEKIVP